jgi:hypothetical protein
MTAVDETHEEILLADDQSRAMSAIGRARGSSSCPTCRPSTIIMYLAACQPMTTTDQTSMARTYPERPSHFLFLERKILKALIVLGIQMYPHILHHPISLDDASPMISFETAAARRNVSHRRDSPSPRTTNPPKNSLSNTRSLQG